MTKEVRKNIEKKNHRIASQVNKGRRRVVFEPGDWVWVHMRKERFPTQRKSKIHLRVDGPFQVIEKINDNAYKLDLPDEYTVSTTFNVADLSPFDVDGEDSWTNHLEEGGNDANKDAHKSKDPIQLPSGPITRARMKKFKDALNGMIQGLWHDLATIQQCMEESNIKLGLEDNNQNLVTLTQVQEGKT